MRKIRVLHFPLRNNFGGISSFILRSWQFIDKSRFLFDFATMSKEPLYFEEELVKQGCKVYHIPLYAVEDESLFISEFEKVLCNYDVVHLHNGYWTSFACEKAAKNVGIPNVIIHAHNTGIGVINGGATYEEALFLHNKLKSELTSDTASRFLACSIPAGDWLYGKSIPKKEIQILNYAIDTELFSYNNGVRESYRKELGILNDFVIGHVGRFERQKNHLFLIDTFSKVCRYLPNTKLVLVGIGADFEIIKNKVEQYKLIEKVILLGKRTDVANLLQAMDVFAFPSFFEGFGIVLIEAQASGLRCIVSDNVPEEAQITDLIQYQPLDTDVWCKKIVELANDSFIRTNYSTEVAKSGYSIKDQIKNLEKIYSGGKIE
ncbi:MAG: glycosyltransferase [Clostridiales bacterium]|nr:glycosyltransferase [Clostridiales bacterium]